MNRAPAGELATAVIIVILIAVAAFYLYQPTGESGNAPTGPAQTEIIISRDFGSQTILVRNITPGQSVMDALQSVAKVKTAYGGGFVVSIDNISSDPGNNLAWFYYVNGFLANVGATHYIIHRGDVIRWDFHYWGNSMLLSAELADFPAMLQHGYSGIVKRTIIGYENAYEKSAENLYGWLKKMNVNATMVSVVNITEEEKKNDNLILIGNHSAIITELFSNYKKLGLKYRVEGGTVKDWNGQTLHGEFAEAVQSPFNPKGTQACENMVIIISGTGNPDAVVHELISGKVDSFWIFKGA